MRPHLPLLLAAALAVPLAARAQTNVKVYYHVGDWDAFDGLGDNNQPLCGIGSRNPTDGGTFSLRFQIGGDDVTFTAAKPGWNIPDGTQIPVVVQVGLEQPWTVQATGSGNRVQWTLDRPDMQTFDGQFRRAASMTVTFPSGNEQPWVIALTGSTAISNTMGRCVTDLARRAAAPEAQPAPAAAPQSATQPFSAPPAEATPPQANPPQANPPQANPAQTNPPQANPAPAQPATQDQPNAAPTPSR